MVREIERRDADFGKPIAEIPGRARAQHVQERGLGFGQDQAVAHRQPLRHVPDARPHFDDAAPQEGLDRIGYPALIVHCVSERLQLEGHCVRWLGAPY